VEHGAAHGAHGLRLQEVAERAAARAAHDFTNPCIVRRAQQRDFAAEVADQPDARGEDGGLVCLDGAPRALDLGAELVDESVHALRPSTLDLTMSRLTIRR
jgi:hypothetical protein